MQITDELLDRICRLSKLDIPEEKRERMKGDFQKMLNFVDQLQAVDTNGVEPLIHMTEEVNHLREDQPYEGMGPEKTLFNAPEKSDRYFVVPKVVKK